MADLYYYETGYIDEKYHVYTADAIVGMGPYIVEGYIEDDYYVDYSAQSSLTCDAEILSGVTVEATGTWSSEIALTVDAGRVFSQLSDLASAFSQSATAVKTVGAEISVDALFTPGLSVDVFKNSTAVIDSVATMSTDGVATRSANVLLEHIADLNAMAAKTVVVDSTMASEFSQSTSAVAIKEAQVEITSAFTQTTTPDYAQLADAQLTVSTALSADGFITNKRPRKYTVVGSPSLSTSNKKFGAASLLASSGNYVQVPASTQLNNWRTIDLWINHNANGLGGTVPLVGRGNDWSLSVFDQSTAGQFRVQFGNNGDFSYTTIVSGLSETWAHIRVVRIDSAPYFRFWVNGVEYGLTANFITTATLNSTQPLTIGESSLTPWSGNNTQVYIDELLITDQVLSTSNFTPPTGAWQPTDQSQIQLLSHYNTDYSDDIGQWEFAQAALTTTAALSASVEPLVKEAQASFTAFDTVVVALVGVKDFTVEPITVTSELTVSLDKIKETTAELASEFTQTVTEQRIRYGLAEFEAFNAELIEGRRVRFGHANLLTQSAVDATATKTKGTSAALTSQTTITVTAIDNEADWNQRVWLWGLKQDAIYDWLEPISVAVDQANDRVFENYKLTDQTDSDYTGFVLVSRDLKSGEVNWQRAYTANNIVKVSNIVLDNGYLYFAYARNTSGAIRSRLVKFNTSTFAFDVDVSSAVDYVNKVKVNSGDVYVAGGSADETVAQISKFDSSLTRQWSRSFDSGTWATDIVVDSSYAYASLGSNNTDLAQFVKLDKSTGVRVLGKSADDNFRNPSIAMDNLGYIWIYSGDDGAGNNAGRLAKLDTSFNIITQKQLQRNGSSFGINKVVFDQDNNLFVAGLFSTLKINYALDTVLWHSIFEYGPDSDPHIYGTPVYDIALDTINKFYWLGMTDPLGGDNILRPRPMTIVGRGLQTTGAGYWEQFGFRDGITVSDGVNDVEGSWSYHLIDTPAVITTESIPLSNYTSTGSTGYNTFSPITLTYLADYELDSYQYAYTVYAFGDLSSQFTGNFTVGMIKGTDVALTTTAAISADATVIRRITLDLPASVSLAAPAVKITDIELDLDNSVSLTTLNSRSRDNEVDLSAEVTQVTDAIKLTTASAAFESEFAQTANNSRLRDFDTEFEAIAIELAAAYKNATGTVTLEATATLTATANKTADEPHYLNSEFSLTAVNERISYVEIDTTASFDVSADVERIQAAGSEMSAEFTISVNTDNSKIAGATANTDSEFSLDADSNNSRIRGLSSSQSANFNTVTDNQILRLAAADLTSQFTILASPTFIVRITADFVAFNSQLTVGDVINIDPFLQIRVRQETRMGTVLPEDRNIKVEQETRVNIIQGYTL